MAADKHFFAPAGDKRLFIIVGAFGSGKTEFALNLALSLAGQGRPAALADLDLVNPYFRSREKGGMLEICGVKMIAPEGALRNADLPSIPPALPRLIHDKKTAGVVDVGGDRTGARVLAAYARDILKQDPSVWYVFNRSRYDNARNDAALTSLKQIEVSCGLRVNGIVHNTHLMGDTTAATVLWGFEAAKRLSELAGMPLVCHCARWDLIDELRTLSPLFPMTLYMNRPWEDG
ncbi:MAG: hypothetical protein PHD27_08075 [Eubacteriales bacterium]|nr:hypothetical protein [Eubacteriales bacterium]